MMHNWQSPITDDPAPDVGAVSVVPVEGVALVDITLSGDSVYGKFCLVE
jgi:hypothetical protein